MLEDEIGGVFADEDWADELGEAIAEGIAEGIEEILAFAAVGGVFFIAVVEGEVLPESDELGLWFGLEGTNNVVLIALLGDATADEADVIAEFLNDNRADIIVILDAAGEMDNAYQIAIAIALGTLETETANANATLYRLTTESIIIIEDSADTVTDTSLFVTSAMVFALEAAIDAATAPALDITVLADIQAAIADLQAAITGFVPEFGSVVDPRTAINAAFNAALLSAESIEIATYTPVPAGTEADEVPFGTKFVYEGAHAALEAALASAAAISAASSDDEVETVTADLVSAYAEFVAQRGVGSKAGTFTGAESAIAAFLAGATGLNDSSTLDDITAAISAVVTDPIALVSVELVGTPTATVTGVLGAFEVAVVATVNITLTNGTEQHLIEDVEIILAVEGSGGTPGPDFGDHVLGRLLPGAPGDMPTDADRIALERALLLLEAIADGDTAEEDRLRTLFGAALGNIERIGRTLAQLAN